MKHKSTIIMALLLTIFFIAAPSVTSYATDVSDIQKNTGNDDVIQISTPEDLKAIKDNPSGNYILTKDIDMSESFWKPFSFSGTLDGNGYSILNLNIQTIGSETADTYDGNYKIYDTYFAGLFSQINNATISNLCLVNLRANINIIDSCFVGSFAGYSDNSTITNCSVSGELSLTVNAPMFGVGGIVGYGNGKISNTSTDTTLICIDTNTTERDEQFLGGACAAGYVDVDNCNIKLQGFVSDHGYVHNGGLIGMYIFYPYGINYYGSITYNHVEGKITFFEDNTDRRAYCKPMIGEIMIYEFEYGGNTENFINDERFEYNTDLLPEACATPDYDIVVTEPLTDTFGYTTYTCKNCGYTFTDNYTIYEEPEEITTVPVTEEITTSSLSTDNNTVTDHSSTNNYNRLIIPVIIVLSLIVVLILLFIKKRTGNGASK